MVRTDMLIRRRRLYEEVVDRIETMIADGELVPGDQLPSERELMERFGVGRPAVREALLALQRMGLVAVSNGERARVTSPTPKTLLAELSGAARRLLAQDHGMQHFQEARALFEIGLAQQAARIATAEDIDRLAEALEVNRRTLGDMSRFEKTDVAFHFVLAMIPKNPIFIAIHEAIVEWLTAQRTISLRNPGADRGAYEAHRRIYKAIAARDPVAAGAAMDDHLQEVARLYRKASGRAKAAVAGRPSKDQ